MIKKTFKAFILTAFISTAAFVPAAFADLETDLNTYSSQKSTLNKGVYYQYSKKYKESFEIFKDLAAKNNPVGAYYYAICLQNGWGIFPRNRAKAEEIYMEVVPQVSEMAKKDDGLLSYTMYIMFRDGYGKQENKIAAIKWLKQATDLGYAIALFDYAHYQEENGQFLEAYNWYLKAADLNIAEAQYHLGEIFEKGGMGVNQNYTEALSYYSKAAKKEHTEAENNLGNLYYKGLGTSQNFPEALRLFKKAAEKGNASATNSIGVMYVKGEGGLGQNYAEALKYFRMAAVLGDINALSNIGNMYYNGLGVKTNYETAFKYYRRAANNGNYEAIYRTAVMYERGIGTEKNPVEAERLFQILRDEGIDTSDLIH